MKNYFGLLVALTFTTNAFSQGYIIQGEMSEDPAFKSYSILPPRIVPPNCPAPKSRKVLGVSETNLIKLFQNVSCESAGKEVIGDSITNGECEMLNQCRSPLNKFEREAIFFETMDFIIRENVRTELAHYKSAESKNLVDLMAYAEKMPEEYKKQIKFCPNYTKTADTCLNEKDFDKLAKTYISTFYSQDEAKTISKRSSALKNKWKTGLNQQFEAYRSAKMAEAVTKNNSTDADFKNFVNIDKYWKEKIQSDSSSFDPAADKLLDTIISSVIVDIEKLPPNEVKEKVKKAVQNFAIDGNELIFSHPNAKNILDSEFEKLNFDAKDFSSADRVSLSKKINQLRVSIANKILNDECSQRVVSIGQMCSKISEGLKAAKVANKPINDQEFFKKIIDWNNKKKSTNDENTKIDAEGKIALFENMQEAQNNIYNRYINLLFNTNTCKEKYPGMMISNQTTSYAVNEFLANAENSAIENRKKAYGEIVESVNKNEELLREFTQSGYKFEGIKTTSSSLDFYRPDNIDRAISKNDNISAVKSTENNMSAPAINGPIVINNPQQRNYDVNNYATPDDSKKNTDYNFNDSYVERLKALEKKESSLSKKIATTNPSDLQDTAANDELAALRKQIEDLKSDKTKHNYASAADKETESADRSKDVDATESPAKYRIDRAVVRTPFSDKDSSDPAPAVAQQSKGQTPSGSADYQADGQTASTAASRTPAAVAQAVAGAGKIAAEKGIDGLSLTKTGDMAVDPSSIMENPNDKDIALYFERVRGGAFIIREKGELVKVSPVLDAKGKPLFTSDGKIKFKKEKLTKAQQELIAKETNVAKAAKEVGVEPIRLFKLKSLLKEVRRE